MCFKYTAVKTVDGKKILYPKGCEGSSPSGRTKKEIVMNFLLYIVIAILVIVYGFFCAGIGIHFYRKDNNNYHWFKGPSQKWCMSCKYFYDGHGCNSCNYYATDRCKTSKPTYWKLADQ